MRSLAGLCLSFPDLPGEEQTNYTSGEERVTSLLPVGLSAFRFHPIQCSWIIFHFTEAPGFYKEMVVGGVKGKIEAEMGGGEPLPIKTGP